MKYLSLFSGIEACTVAWKDLGWEAVAFAQYEPGDKAQFPSQVLKYHYPDVPNLGDVTKITEEQIAALGHIDLVVGGSPCQDLSLAGKRASLRNEDGSLTRSGLFDYQMQIFEWARRNNGARFLLWENVPGCFSSGREVKGADFAYILGSMVQRDVSVPSDGWKNSGVCTSADWSRIVEWRVVDAQYFRETPQRRRRCFALLDTGAWWSRQSILLEPEGLSGDSEKSEGTQQGSSYETGDGTEEYCRSNTYGWMPRCLQSNPTRDVAQPLTRTDYKDPSLVSYPEIDTYGFQHTQMSMNVDEDCMPPLMRRDYKDPPLVGYPTAYAIRTSDTKANGIGVQMDVAHTLNCVQPEAVAYPSDTGRGGVLCMTTGNHPEITRNVSPTLKQRDCKDPVIVFMEERR